MSTIHKNLTIVFFIPGNPAKAYQGYVDWAIQVDIPNNEVMRNPDGRDIYCYPGRDLWIDNYSNQVIKV